MLETPQPQVRWPAFTHVVFDCDSTLTSIEGIDVLADGLGVGAQVAAMTDAAMAGDVDLSDVYGARMALLQPSRQAIAELRAAYKRHVVPDAAGVIAALRALDIEVWVVSGGLVDPVEEFAVSLGVEPGNVRAVEARHDKLSGDWWKAGTEPVDEAYAGFEEGALTQGEGKREVIASILDRDKGNRSMLVGDGASDLEAADAVDLFVGFGGVVARPRVAEVAPLFITTESLAPVLPLAAGPQGGGRLEDPVAIQLFDRGVQLIANGALRFHDEATMRQLASALDIEGIPRV